MYHIKHDISSEKIEDNSYGVYDGCCTNTQAVTKAERNH